MKSIWENYKTDVAYDELMYSEFQSRPVSHQLCRYLDTLKKDDIEKRKNAAELAIMEMAKYGPHQWIQLLVFVPAKVAKKLSK